MALLSISERERILNEEGFEYTKKGIKGFQKKYMKRKRDIDGIWGPDTDNTARTVDNVRKNCKNFIPSEFVCECGGKYCCGFPSYMKVHELKHIQAIRDHYGKPMEITSGLRCKTQNSRVGGAANSGHLRGFAVDFHISGVTDTAAQRKKALEWIVKQPYHKFTYGAYMVSSEGDYRTAAGMGNAMHTETK